MTTALANYREELAKAAKEVASTEQVGGGRFFSTKSGVLSLDKVPFKNNQMAVVVVASTHERVFYEGVFDANNPSSPLCYSFDDTAPHPKSPQPQHPTCEGCPKNEWGTANTGKGKACKEQRRLACLPAGKLDESGRLPDPVTDPDHYKDEAVAYLKVPTMSVKGWSSYVSKVAATLNLPPFAVYTRVKVVPDAKAQFLITFELLGECNDEAIGALMQRHKDEQAVIAFPYAVFESAPAGEKAPPKRSSKF